MKLSLGTAQFGFDYGISNKIGQVKKKELFKILDFCHKNNIFNLDTAKSYGNAEKILGQYYNINRFKINTKITNINTIKDIKNIKKNIEDSIQKLNIKNIQVCYIHSFNDIKKKKDANKIFLELNKLKKNKKIKKIGISLYSVDELRYCLKNYKFDVIQIPINIFNQDFCEKKILQILKKRKIEIEARSIFLQGFFFLKENQLSKKFNSIKNELSELRKVYNSNKKILVFCLGFIKKISNIKRVVIGVTKLKELKIIVREFNKQKKININYQSFKSKNILRNSLYW
jgi:aryl-alcohol dehydrogenase-like predicted oxidoreductase